MPNAILDPTGQSTSRQQAAVLAPRKHDLRGVTVGLLENTKQNAGLFLEEVGKLLVDRHGAAGYVRQVKKGFATPVTPEQLADLAGQVDVVVTGVGDCGSCSAAGAADGVAFERHGIPAAVISTEMFTASTEAMAKVHGAPDYQYVTTQHPVAGLTPEQIRERAERALPDIVALLQRRNGATSQQLSNSATSQQRFSEGGSA